ncbi:hypothetical protein [Enterococcus sp. DIV0098]|uniref:hypothetical protein n=1 Tax=Enterococcus sp. DIV0098 TaxID=2774843 RepID=UPI003A2296DB
MKNQDIYSVAVSFHAAILEAKYNREFDRRDRMSNFPYGCCDDSCDLLAYYLYTEYGINTKQGTGTYRDNDPNNTTSHAWLVMDNGTIIDITIKQLQFFSKYDEGVYVGKENSFYKNLERHQIYENYNICQNERLWKDYQIITNGIRV